MVLIITDVLKKEVGPPLKDSSLFYISIVNTYLSEAYDLLDGDEIKGVITVVKDQSRRYEALSGKEITLILKKSVIFDYLFLSKSDWQKHFREWGVVTPGYTLQVRLTKAVKKTTRESVKLYTNADVYSGVPLP